MFRLLRLKPPHGWNAVAWELGIVTLGVLIALAAQQFVESRQWRSEVVAERASLLQEASDALGVVAARNAQVPCVDRRLAEIRTVLERHRRGEPLGLVGEIAHPNQQTATRGTWAPRNSSMYSLMCPLPRSPGSGSRVRG